MTRAEIAKKLLESQEKEFLLRDHLRASAMHAEQVKVELERLDRYKISLIEQLGNAEI